MKIETNRSETVTGKRYDEYEYLNGRYPVGKERPMILEVVKLPPDVGLLCDALAKRMAALRENRRREV